MEHFPADEPNGFYNSSVRRLMNQEKSQADKFRDLARELECDEDEKRFDKALRRVGSAPPPEKGDKPKKGRDNG